MARRTVLRVMFMAGVVVSAAAAATAGPVMFDTGDGNGADSYVRLGEPDAKSEISDQ